MKGTILLTAGGTGGHLFPAEAVAQSLIARGFDVALATDRRALKYISTFPTRNIKVFASDTPTHQGWLRKLRAGFVLLWGIWQSVKYLRHERPQCIVGFGGYPTVPPILAAALLKIPIVLHEQNAVMGRSNAFLSRWARRVATGFQTPLKEAPNLQHKQIHTGNPVRRKVIEAATFAYPKREATDALTLVVTGGSQGAKGLTQVIPQALSLLTSEMRAQIRLFHQVRLEDIASLKATYQAMAFSATLAAFFQDLPYHMAQAHLVIGRAGASTITELATLGRPSVLVPLPGALDQDQTANAKCLEGIGAALIVQQRDCTPEKVAKILKDALENPEKWAQMGSAAHRLRSEDAAERLADWVERTALEGSIKGEKRHEASVTS